MINKLTISVAFISILSLPLAGCESGGGSDDETFVGTSDSSARDGDRDDSQRDTGDNIFDSDGMLNEGDLDEGERGTRDGMTDGDDFLHGGSGGVGGSDDTGGGTGGRSITGGG